MNKLHTTLPLLALACSMLLASQSASAEIYKYKDKNGVVHYSDKPPENQSAARQINFSSTQLPPSDNDPKKNTGTSELAKQADERLAREKKERNAGNAQKQEAEDKCKAAQKKYQETVDGSYSNHAARAAAVDAADQEKRKACSN